MAERIFTRTEVDALNWATKRFWGFYPPDYDLRGYLLDLADPVQCLEDWQRLEEALSLHFGKLATRTSRSRPLAADRDSMARLKESQRYWQQLKSEALANPPSDSENSTRLCGE